MNTPALHIMVDAHVHIHEHFNLNRLFLISLQNFRKALQAFQIFEPFESLLLLTESSGSHHFDRLRSLTGSDPSFDFTISPTPEKTTIRVTTGGGQALFVVAGRQIVTAERLEVLALGFDGSYPDGRPLPYVLEDLAESGCLRVLPWGAGKWLGRRGAIIESLVGSWNGGPLFLGDNGNRPSLWPVPGIFRQAQRQGIYNLPGSDPLPFREHEKKAGSYGFMLRGSLDHDQPFASLAARLAGDPSAAVPFGTPERLRPFLKNQISMQMARKGR